MLKIAEVEDILEKEIVGRFRHEYVEEVKRIGETEFDKAEIGRIEC